MSLIHKQEMTEENLAAKRANGSLSEGPVTPEGKANSAAANLRHGLYSKAQNGALTALGEDPEEYAALMNSPENNLAEGLDGQLVELIGDNVWRMKRAKRAQDGVARKRIQAGIEAQEARIVAHRRQAYENLSYYEDMVTALSRGGDHPTPDEIHTFVQQIKKDDPSEETKEFFILLKSLNNLPKGPERNATRREARTRLQKLMQTYGRVCRNVEDRLEEMRSPENLAALTAPRDENDLLSQRLEDSGLRKMWRLTNMLFRVREGALAPGSGEQTPRNIKNEDRSDYVYENKENGDKMSCEKTDFVQENAPLVQENAPNER